MYNLTVSSKYRNYEIIIKNGLFDELKNYLDDSKKYVIIYDDQIPEIYVEKVQCFLTNPLLISFPAGEKSKSFSELIRIIGIMQNNNVKRDAIVIALGGGVTGDLAGFVASIYNRGIDYIQIPTTLLSQIDSSVGGKVAINTNLAKNSVGNFYPPKMVLIDPNALKTLSKRHFNNGIAEMIKYGMIASKQLFNQLFFPIEKLDITKLIYESLKIKKYFVENDEYDKSIRQALNFGHTFGHAYEAYYNFEKYLHGEAIGLGMLQAVNNIETKNMLIKLLKNYSLPIEDPIESEKLMTYIIKDKKNTEMVLNMIFVNKIGSYEITPINLNDL